MQKSFSERGGGVLWDQELLFNRTPEAASKSHPASHMGFPLFFSFLRKITYFLLWWPTTTTTTLGFIFIFQDPFYTADWIWNPAAPHHALTHCSWMPPIRRWKWWPRVDVEIKKSLYYYPVKKKRKKESQQLILTCTQR